MPEQQLSRNENELVVPPGKYAYMQDTASGAVKVSTGPCIINQTAQAVPVIFDPKDGFKRCRLEEAVKPNAAAVEGYYLVLYNPTKHQPEFGQSDKRLDDTAFQFGRRINITGPVMFPLWPGQYAYPVRGHHLRSNQYLLVRVYNEEEARANWGKAIIKPAAESATDAAEATSEESPTQKVPTVMQDVPDDLTVGKTLVIRGTKVSFYIPPTGITVVPDNEGVYVREALTLERLEYCILIDEDGNKRFERGPQVVFPKPTERFYESDGAKKFRALELNEIQGIHLKVIAPYRDGDTLFEEGQELFITGKETAIYFPRPEHSLIKYDGKAKHFATAIPAGEARYVLNRITGEIKTVRGPDMYLPDPRKEVFVVRVLTDKQVQLWYPGNEEARHYNLELRKVEQRAPTTRRGVVSDGDLERSKRGKPGKERLTRSRSLTLGDMSKSPSMSVNYSASLDSFTAGDTGNDLRSMEFAMDTTKLGETQATPADEFSRRATYTEPRTIRLESKYSGVPVIEPWTGYAVMVVSKTGERRVEIGPKTLQLAYDEGLEVLALSTGKPKNTDELFQTVYLRVRNNKVADIVSLETLDHVALEAKLSYKVDFVGDSSKWFDSENYVKLLCDHVRSVLKSAVKKLKIADFYDNSPDIIRDVILGEKDAEGEGKGRLGMLFTENNMHILDVEVLMVRILDKRIQDLLDSSQHRVVQGNIELANKEHAKDLLERSELLDREEATIREETEKHRRGIETEAIKARLGVETERFTAQKSQAEKEKEAAEAENAVLAERNNASIARNKATEEARLVVAQGRLDQEIRRIETETKAAVDKFTAASNGFSSALTTLGDREAMIKMAQAMSFQRLIGGNSVAEVIGGLFQGTPLKDKFDRMLSRGRTPKDQDLEDKF